MDAPHFPGVGADVGARRLLVASPEAPVMPQLAARFALLAALGLAAPAGAATIDFTDRSVWSDASSTQTLVGGVIASISALNGSIDFSQNYDGSSCPTAISCVSDGAGVSGDEVTDFAITGQTFIVSFSRAVRVAGLGFLDLFADMPSFDSQPDPMASEGAIVDLGGGDVRRFAGSEPYAPGGSGWLWASLDVSPVTQLRFTADVGNDGVGSGDYAVAAIDVASAPLPAAGLMLAAALGGAAAWGRRARG